MSRTTWVKASVAAVGLAVGIGGMALERRWLVWVGVALLGVVFALRLVERRAASEP